MVSQSTNRSRRSGLATSSTAASIVSAFAPHDTICPLSPRYQLNLHHHWDTAQLLVSANRQSLGLDRLGRLLRLPGRAVYGHRHSKKIPPHVRFAAGSCACERREFRRDGAHNLE